MVMGWDLLTYYRLSLQVSEAIITGNSEAAPGLHKALQPWTDRVGVMGDAQAIANFSHGFGPAGHRGHAAPVVAAGIQSAFAAERRGNRRCVGRTAVAGYAESEGGRCGSAKAGSRVPGRSRTGAVSRRYRLPMPRPGSRWRSSAGIAMPARRRLRAWRLARLVAPREGYVLEERAAFGLDHWEDLEPADRGSVVRDSVLALTPGLSVVRMKEVLANKPVESRAQIERDLREEGGMTPGRSRFAGSRAGQGRPVMTRARQRHGLATSPRPRRTRSVVGRRGTFSLCDLRGAAGAGAVLFRQRWRPGVGLERARVRRPARRRVAALARPGQDAADRVPGDGARRWGFRFCW